MQNKIICFHIWRHVPLSYSVIKTHLLFFLCFHGYTHGDVWLLPEISLGIEGAGKAWPILCSQTTPSRRWWSDSTEASAVPSKDQAFAPVCMWRRKNVHFPPRGTETGMFIMLFPPFWSIQAVCLSQDQLIPNNNSSRRTDRVIYRAPLPNSSSLSSEGVMPSSLGDQKPEREKDKTGGKWKAQDDGRNSCWIKFLYNCLYAADFCLEGEKRQVSLWTCASWIKKSEHLREKQKFLSWIQSQSPGDQATSATILANVHACLPLFLPLI